MLCRQWLASPKKWNERVRTDYAAILKALDAAGVEYVVIGGLALAAHGYPRFTEDVDICYARNRANLSRLVSALTPLSPTLRGAPPGLPFAFDEATLRSGLNFTLLTSAGAIDLLGEVTGIGTYERLLPGATEYEVFGVRAKFIGLDDLERAKAAAGRPKDLFDLEAIRELKNRSRR